MNALGESGKSWWLDHCPRGLLDNSCHFPRGRSDVGPSLPPDDSIGREFGFPKGWLAILIMMAGELGVLPETVVTIMIKHAPRLASISPN